MHLTGGRDARAWGRPHGLPLAAWTPTDSLHVSCVGETGRDFFDARNSAGANRLVRPGVRP
eukprot:scaffold31549_cov44-Phaeocystis_antarctica.AAC.1